MNKEVDYLIYCDESCHLSYDKSDVMSIGAVICGSNARKRICRDIVNIKKKYNVNIRSEMKWIKISKSNKLEMYLELIEYFFNEPSLNFRGIVALNKNSLVFNETNNNDYNTWYYKMYFLMLNTIIMPTKKYNIYIDIKDSKGGQRTRKLHDVLCNNIYDFKRETINKVQQIRSDEVEIMQITDLIIGALSYLHRYKNDIEEDSPKYKIIEKIRENSGFNLLSSTSIYNEKFNLFIWEPKNYGI